jgi:hypothetical protein
MGKYVLVYTDGGGMAESEPDMQAIMAEWGAWFESLGAAVADGGAPFGPSSTVAANGSVSSGAAAQLTGYSILEAGSLDAAAKLTAGCPVLAAGGAVQIYEAIDVSGM